MLVIAEVTAEIKALITELNLRAPLLREIHNKGEHEQALLLMEALLEDYETNLVAIEALGNAISRYESQAELFSEFNEQLNVSDPAVATLMVLMEQHGLNTTDFEAEIGKKSMVSQVLKGNKRLTRDHIERLAKRFQISPALFFG